MSPIDKSWFKINHQSAMPLYYQIKQSLLEIVESGKFTPGDILPAESEMGEYYGVSRLTVRQAVGELVREGVLVRERGRGTFVARPKTTHSMVRTSGFSERIREAGRVPSSQVLSYEIISAPASVAENLQIAEGLPIYKLVRLRSVDGEPQLIETTHLPQAMFPGMENVDFSQTSLYSTLAERFDCLVIAADEVFEPILVTSYEAGLLGTKTRSAALLLEIVAYDQYGNRVEYNKSVVRGDKARLLFHVRRQILNDKETRVQWASSELSKKD
jgi:DNA-binding GntR family transcriptional regulator